MTLVQDPQQQKQTIDHVLTQQSSSDVRVYSTVQYCNVHVYGTLQRTYTVKKLLQKYQNQPTSLC